MDQSIQSKFSLVLDFESPVNQSGPSTLRVSQCRIDGRLFVCGVSHSRQLAS